MKVNPKIPCALRFSASIPTTDTERKAPFFFQDPWNPSHINLFGHNITIDIPTGNVVISTIDLSYPYYNMPLEISRKYDTQEQWMQLSTLRDYPNINPKPHFYGNWQLAFEAEVDEVWRDTYPELHITSGIGVSGLFENREPDFKRNYDNENRVEELLRSYGIPERTLTEMDWKFSKHDFLLRTLRGPFQLISGHFHAETFTDDVNAEIWLFNPISGCGYHITSEFFFNIKTDNYRDMGYPLIIEKKTDPLGHKIQLYPKDTAPPFKNYVLCDGSGREFQIECNHELSFIDGLNPRNKVRKHLISKIRDATKSVNNIFEYFYDRNNLLEEVRFPSTIGNRCIHYIYESQKHPGILSSIEDSNGNAIQFEYLEDQTDNDDQLNPRLKIKKIIDPEGITYEYEYNHPNSEVMVTISKNGIIDRKIKFRYIRDLKNTKQRYISLSEIEVRRGYLTDLNQNIVLRQQNEPQIVKTRTEYSEDGRYNIEKEFDPLNRFTRYQYNDFNQIQKVWDFDNHLTENFYDIPIGRLPSVQDPIRYDLISVAKENIIREVDPNNSSSFIETPIIIEKKYEYDKYDEFNSSAPDDYGAQSTHRLSQETDERSTELRQIIWKYSYDDLNNNNPILPTCIESPLGNKTYSFYNNRGEKTVFTDAEGNRYTYRYNNQSNITEYINPNQEKITLAYYPCGNWLHKFEDHADGIIRITEFIRNQDGKIVTVIDPVQDSTDYNYFKNGRIRKITRHRPEILSDPNDSRSPSLTIPNPNLDWSFLYTPLGKLTSLANPKGLELIFDYDENGRIYHWYLNVPFSKKIVFVYDEAGQLKFKQDADGNVTCYLYYPNGFLKSIEYPKWNNGHSLVDGKKIEYERYDYLENILTLTDSEIGRKELTYDKSQNLGMRRESNGVELFFAYDDDNRLVNITDCLNAMNVFFKLDLTLDALGRAEKMLDSDRYDGSVTWDYSYRKQVGAATKVLNLYSIKSSINLNTEFDYCLRHSLKSLIHKWTNPLQTIFSQGFEYRMDNIVEKITGDNSNEFRYDGIKQLIEEVGTAIKQDYDPAGNRIYRLRKDLDPTPLLDVYDANNHLIISKNDYSSQANLRYDEKGNLAEIEFPTDSTRTIKFSFDGANRLRIFENASHNIQYSYDEEGNLIERIATDKQTHVTERYTLTYLFTKPIIIHRNGNLHAILTWDVDGRLLRIRSPTINGQGNYPQSLFALYDGIGNLTRMVNDDRIETVKLSYDPWGNPTIINDTDILFFGYFKKGLIDKTTNLCLFGERWYSPIVGRFLSEDPLPSRFINNTEFAEDLSNLYVFSHNNPISFSDPSGLFFLQAIALIVIAAQLAGPLYYAYHSHYAATHEKVKHEGPQLCPAEGCAEEYLEFHTEKPHIEAEEPDLSPPKTLEETKQQTQGRGPQERGPQEIELSPKKIRKIRRLRTPRTMERGGRRQRSR